MDAKRVEAGLTWAEVAREIWARSADLNASRPGDHPISPAALTGIASRGDCSCQHALFILRWLRVPPEYFTSPPVRADAALPAAGRRLRWNLPALYAALDSNRKSRGLTWPALAQELRCTSHQLTGIRTARFVIGMRLAMRIAAWLDRPASAFIVAGPW